MAIKSAGTYMQISDLCKSCSKQNICGNGMTDYYCTGYAPCVETRMNFSLADFAALKKRNEQITSVISLGNEIIIYDNNVVFGQKTQNALKKLYRKQKKNRRRWG